jgi:hypothetical protein
MKLLAQVALLSTIFLVSLARIGADDIQEPGPLFD